jgi:hypothetical protein
VDLLQECVQCSAPTVSCKAWRGRTGAQGRRARVRPSPPRPGRRCSVRRRNASLLSAGGFGALTSSGGPLRFARRRLRAEGMGCSRGSWAAGCVSVVASSAGRSIRRRRATPHTTTSSRAVANFFPLPLPRRLPCCQRPSCSLTSSSSDCPAPASCSSPKTVRLPSHPARERATRARSVTNIRSNSSADCRRQGYHRRRGYPRG